jgi:hypothetical protein
MDPESVAERRAAWISHPDNHAARDAAYAAVLRRQTRPAELEPAEPEATDVAAREEYL